MSKIKLFAASLGLSVTDVTVQSIHPVIFGAKITHSQFGNIVDNNGVPTMIDVVSNSATPLTPDVIKDATVIGLKSEKPSAFQATSVVTSENCGTISKLSFTKTTGASSAQSIVAFAKATGMKVIDCNIDVQHDIIFSTVGVKTISGLTEANGELYQIDLASNTATVINSAALSEKAKTDLMAMKATDATRFVEAFGLITSLTLSKEA